MSLRVTNLSVRYADHLVLRALDLHAQPGELLGVIGPNGSGKTTLIKACTGLLPAAAGVIELAGVALPALTPDARARALAYLPQGHLAHWPIAVHELVSLGRLPFHDANTHSASVQRALELADVTQFAQRRVSELSSGERARVMLARALAVDAPILLADEPVAALDPRHQLRIMELLRSYARTRTVVVVLHDLALAARFCQRLVLLERGVKVADGAPAAVLRPELLARVYGIEALHARHDDQNFVLPWRCLDGPGADF